MRDRGKGDGISSTESECGSSLGPLAIDKWLMPLGPCACEAVNAPGVGGGDVPILFRSFRVTGGRE